MRFKTELKSSIARSFVFYILLFSSFVALISTSIQLFYEYKRDFNAIQRTADQIERSHKSTISQALWTYDSLILKSQLKGINNLPGVLYACVKKEDQILEEIGIRARDQQVILYAYTIEHTAKGKQHQLGTLEVQISLSEVYEHLWNRVVLILITQTLKTFFVSLFILFLFYFIVGRHLNAMADFAKSINMNTLEDNTFILNRKKGKTRKPDELGLVESALNRMRIKLLDEMKNVQLTQDALKESEERFKLAMEANKDGLWDWNIETSQVYYSPAYSAMLGYDSLELPPHVNSWQDLIHPEDKEKALKANMDCIENRCDSFQVEFRMQAKNGEWCWILGKGKAVERDQDGKASRMVGTHRNITNRKIAEETLRKNERDLKASQRIAHLGSWRLEIATNEVFWTKELYKMYGFDPKLPPPPYTEHMKLFTPESWQRLSSAIEKTKKTGSPYELELEMTKENHPIGWMWVRGEAIKDSRGKTTGLWGVAQDITERKQNEEKLNLQSAIITRMSEGVSLVNEDGIIVYTNPAFEKMFGYQPGEMNGLHVSILNAPTGKSPEETAEKIFTALGTKGYWAGEVENIKKDGTLFWSAAKVTGLDRLKNETAFITVQTDISELRKTKSEKKALESKLQQAQKMESIGNLAGGIAHDFNNLLFPIIGMSEMLLEDLPKESLEHENAKEILHAGKRAGDLVQQILAFSRQSEYKLTPVRIQNVLKEVLKLSRSTIPSNIEIHHSIDPNCGLVMADPTQIHQIAMNLITNASHALGTQNGIIDIELKETFLKKNELPGSDLPPGPYLIMSVSDNGTGIPKKAIDKIFEPYFTTKEKGKGTGMGLAVVYGIVKKCKGDIKVYSEIEKGTTFNIYLPMMERSSDIIMDLPVTDRAATGREHILLVDDEASVAKLEGQMLSRLGYQVTVKTSSIEALNTFQANPHGFDLVISDMTMPNMTGDELARQIFSITPATPIIICTGFSERINKEQAEIMGIKGFLMKPVVKADLARTVREVLDRPDK